MISPLTYYHKIKNEQHVFIYCVAGRSSSTAFQRILNSSNAVWIWGEQHSIIEETVAVINLMKTCRNDYGVKTSLIKMYDSYLNNKHLNFYPNAIGNLDTTIDILNSSISNMLKPWKPTLTRFGFKDIGIKDIQILNHLKEIFPQSLVMFCFRDPLTQWPSVHVSGWWTYCLNLESYLDEYYRLSNIYLEFSSNANLNTFVENTDLRDYNKIKTIIRHLNVPKIDVSLIDITVGSNKSNKLSSIDKETILNSNAYKNYLKMKCLSEAFYKK